MERQLRPQLLDHLRGVAVVDILAGVIADLPPAAAQAAPHHQVHAVDVGGPKEVLPLVDDEAVKLRLPSGFPREVQVGFGQRPLIVIALPLAVRHQLGPPFGREVGLQQIVERPKVHARVKAALQEATEVLVEPHIQHAIARQLGMRGTSCRTQS
ncbi:MAG: hypothetical protein Q8P50_14590 [Bacillota bacterium]|nr:hypothetical protein [Bacillota bacterium]